MSRFKRLACLPPRSFSCFSSAAILACQVFHKRLDTITSPTISHGLFNCVNLMSSQLSGLYEKKGREPVYCRLPVLMSVQLLLFRELVLTDYTVSRCVYLVRRSHRSVLKSEYYLCFICDISYVCCIDKKPRIICQIAV